MAPRRAINFPARQHIQCPPLRTLSTYQAGNARNAHSESPLQSCSAACGGNSVRYTLRGHRENTLFGIVDTSLSTLRRTYRPQGPDRIPGQISGVPDLIGLAGSHGQQSGFIGQPCDRTPCDTNYLISAQCTIAHNGYKSNIRFPAPERIFFRFRPPTLANANNACRCLDSRELLLGQRVDSIDRSSSFAYRVCKIAHGILHISVLRRIFANFVYAGGALRYLPCFNVRCLDGRIVYPDRTRRLADKGALPEIPCHHIRTRRKRGNTLPVAKTNKPPPGARVRFEGSSRYGPSLIRNHRKRRQALRRQKKHTAGCTGECYGSIRRNAFAFTLAGNTRMERIPSRRFRAKNVSITRITAFAINPRSCS